ncbi:hypothetical protein JCM8208_006405 [Rhodotorula glutinis]
MASHASPTPLIDLITRSLVDDLADGVLKAASTLGFLFLRMPQDGKAILAGRRYAAPVVSGVILVNLGFAVEAWTSGVLRATLHRAIVQLYVDGGFRARGSTPYVVQPRNQVRSSRFRKRSQSDRHE